jgi:hypothetical protein
MTALPNPDACPPSSSPVMRVSDQGELIAAIPAMIGFHPRDSLVLLATGGSSGRRLGLCLRIDLPTPEDDGRVELIAHFVVRALLKGAPAGAVVVVIGGGGDPPPHTRLVAFVVEELERHKVDVHTVLWADGTGGGARWGCYDLCGCTGVVPEPASTAYMAAVVAEGQVVHTDRSALERVVAPVDDAHLRRRERLLLAALDGPLDGTEAAPYPVAVDTAAGVRAVDAAIADTAAGRLVLNDERVVALATALANTAVRDTALLRSAGSRAGAAEHLWAALARETPDPEAAEPAALLAVSALLRGDGALANVALDRAERAWPGHRLSRLLRVATEGGLRPSEVRAWLRECDLVEGARSGRRRPRSGRPR